MVGPRRDSRRGTETPAQRTPVMQPGMHLVRISGWPGTHSAVEVRAAHDPQPHPSTPQGQCHTSIVTGRSPVASDVACCAAAGASASLPPPAVAATTEAPCPDELTSMSQLMPAAPLPAGSASGAACGSSPASIWTSHEMPPPATSSVAGGSSSSPQLMPAGAATGGGSAADGWAAGRRVGSIGAVRPSRTSASTGSSPSRASTSGCGGLSAGGTLQGCRSGEGGHRRQHECGSRGVCSQSSAGPRQTPPPEADERHRAAPGARRESPGRRVPTCTPHTVSVMAR